MQKVVVISNYTYPDISRQSPASKGIWGDYEFSFRPTEECDFLIVINYPLSDIRMKVNKGMILLVQEPPYPRNEYYRAYFKYFDVVISHFTDEKRNFRIPGALPWMVNKTYDQLLIEPDSIGTVKNEIPVWITSNARINEGHDLRLDFIDYLKKEKFDFQLYGRGFHPVDDKYPLFAASKYVIAVENYIADDYFTEKIVDPILSLAYTFYYGCSNLEKYLPENSFCAINLKDFKEAKEMMEEKIRNNAWQRFLPEIKEAKKIVLEKHQFFPMMTRFMRQMDFERKYPVTVFIPKDPFEEKSFVSKAFNKLFRKKNG